MIKRLVTLWIVIGRGGSESLVVMDIANVLLCGRQSFKEFSGHPKVDSQSIRSNVVDRVTIGMVTRLQSLEF